MRRIPSALVPVIFIPGLAFEALLRMRAFLHSTSIFPQHRLPGPVISIGNMTMGGSGKTPLVIYIARMLVTLGVPPAILSRGYKRRRPNTLRILPPSATVPSPAFTLGDEPALIRRHIPSAWMGLSKNRYLAGTHIAKQLAKAVFVLDDGFQHRKLFRDLDIVVVDRNQPLGKNRVFPRGTLREPISELRRCHVIVINGDLDAKSDSFEEEIRKLHAKAEIFRCKQRIQSFVPFSAWVDGRTHGDVIESVKSVYAAAAIGNPGRFLNDVQRTGVEVCGTGFFADHYGLTEKDWAACVQEARGKGAEAIVTTEKDAVKISRPPDFPLLVSVQSTEISDTHAFERILRNCIEECP